MTASDSAGDSDMQALLLAMMLTAGPSEPAPTTEPTLTLTPVLDFPRPMPSAKDTWASVWDWLRESFAPKLGVVLPKNSSAY